MIEWNTSDGRDEKEEIKDNDSANVVGKVSNDHG
jgi:hypothetical protein